MKRIWRLGCAWVLAGALAFGAYGADSASTPASAAPLQPEIATGRQAKADVRASRFMVASANPLATQAGFDMLQAGGSAIDAAVAVQMVLGLVEPQSSGIGGGAFLMHSTGSTVQAYDGRETAPAAADEALLLRQGQPMPFHEAAVGGRAVGTPGVLRMLALAHREHGRLPWASLFEPAITLAEQGFAVSARLHAQLKADPYLRLNPAARVYFYQENGEPHPVGHRLRNPALAEVYRRIAREGVQAFYEGELAQAIVQTVQNHPTNPGRLTLADLSGYQARERAPLCFDHSALSRVYRVCGMGPPGSGTLAIGQILGLLQRTPADRMPWPDALPDAGWLHYYSEVSRLAFADRAQYVADPDFVSAPGGDWASLLSPRYLDQRAQGVGPARMPQVQAGVPLASLVPRLAPSPLQVEYGTSHLSIVDAQGRAVAMTTTVEDAFGARQMVRGFLLNNQLTDFSFVPRDAQGLPIANRVQPGKRPRSSMSPLLVFDKATGQLVMSAGSPGGAMIIHFTAKTLYGVFHRGLSPQQAIDLPNFGTVGGPMVLEASSFSPAVSDALRGTGAEVREQPLTSGVQAIVRANDGASGWVGGADARREGVVMGR